jgi:hypothetical protein
MISNRGTTKLRNTKRMRSCQVSLSATRLIIALSDQRRVFSDWQKGGRDGSMWNQS